MRKNIMLKVFVALIVSVLAFGGVFAQEQSGGTGFRVTDPRREVTIDPGETITDRISVRNIGGNKQTARAIVEDFVAPDDESEFPRLILNSEQTEASAYSIRPFVQDIQDVELEPGQETEVPVTISIPEDASPGSYFGSIRFINIEDVGSEISQESSTVALNASVGVIFLVSVPGTTVDLLSLEQVGVASGEGASPSSVFSSAPDTFVLRLKNEGNTFQAPFGTIRVTDWSGNTIQEFEFNNGTPRGVVLPDSVRRFEESLEDIGSFGRYKISGFISYGDGGNTIEINTTFWVVPWVTVAIVSVLVVGGAFFATRGIKAYNRAVVKKAKGKSSKNMK